MASTTRLRKLFPPYREFINTKSVTGREKSVSPVRVTPRDEDETTPRMQCADCLRRLKSAIFDDVIGDHEHNIGRFCSYRFKAMFAVTYTRVWNPSF